VRYAKAAFSAVAAAGFALAFSVVASAVLADRMARARVMAEPTGPNTVVMRPTAVDVPLWPSLVVAGVVGVGMFYVRTRKKTSAD